MKDQTKQLMEKIVSWLGLFFFLIASFMLYKTLSKYSFAEIKSALFNIPRINLFLACLACFFGYIALSLYDRLALSYIGKKLSPLKWIFVGVIGFSVSNNAGHALVSGGAIRYRLYTRWRFRAAEIIKMVLFSGFTYLVGSFALFIIGHLLVPAGTFNAKLSSSMKLIFLASAISLVGYYALAYFWKKPLIIKGVTLKMPSLKMALIQTALGAFDSLCASLVLYFVLIPFVTIPFDVFIGVFVIAQVLGVFSQVPGGVGVFEWLFLLALPGDNNKAVLFGALIAYRIIYYFIPLVISGILLFSYEYLLLRARKKLRQKIRQKQQA